jgi:hypothetical protein
MKKSGIMMFVISAALSGCGVYNPITSDIPLISNKNDLRIDGGRSFSESVGATVSYGLTDKLALQVAGSRIAENKDYYFQFAPGYYKNLGDRKIMEIYLGYGAGTGYAYNDPHPGNIQGRYQLYFAQINIGKIDAKFAHTDLGIGFKTGYLHSDLIDAGYYAVSSTGNYKFDCATFEPHAILRLGTENIKVCFKLAGCFIVKFNNIPEQYPYFYLNAGLGLNFNF